MIFEITKDQEFVKYCLTHPYVWRNSVDDALINVDPDLFFPPMNGVVYVKAGEFGLLVGRPINFINYDVHIALLPQARGLARDICSGAMKFIFNSTERPLRLTASIPSFNIKTIKLACDIGMEFIGINKKSFMVNGVLFDQHLFGIGKEDLCHH